MNKNGCYSTGIWTVQWVAWLRSAPCPLVRGDSLGLWHSRRNNVVVSSSDSVPSYPTEIFNYTAAHRDLHAQHTGWLHIAHTSCILTDGFTFYSEMIVIKVILVDQMVNDLWFTLLCSAHTCGLNQGTERSWHFLLPTTHYYDDDLGCAKSER